MGEPETPDAPPPPRDGLPPAALDAGGRARFLVICRGGVGRAVDALPVLHALRAGYPGSATGWLVDERFAPLLRGHPELDRLHEIPRSAWKALSWWKRRRATADFGRALASHRYTVVVDLHGDRDSARFARSSGAPVRISYAPPEGAVLGRRHYTCRIVPSPRVKHVAERNLSLLVPLAVRRAAPAYVFPDLARAGERALAKFAPPPAGRYAVLHPGASWPSRQWPVDSCAELARALASEMSLEVFVTAGDDVERSRAEAAAKVAGEGARVAPRLELDELAAFVAGAALFVGGDAGPMHLASALGVPTVAILGPTTAARRGPRGGRSRPVDAGLACGGCGRASCPFGTAACMKKVEPGAVLALAREALA